MTASNFRLELLFKQPGVSYNVCGLFNKHRQRIQKFREAGNLKLLYRNKLNKICFAHDRTYSDSKNLPRRTISQKILKDGAYGWNC